MVRRVLFTINNPDFTDLTRLREIPNHPQFRYLIFQGEVGQEGTPHFQGYLEILKNQSQTFFKNLLGERAHIEFCRGTSMDNIHYCSKPVQNSDGSYCQCDHCKDALPPINPPEIYGEPSKELSGARFWDSIKECITQNMTDMQIIELYPNAAGNLQSIHKFRQAYKEELYRLKKENYDPECDRRERIRVVWVYGKSGSGKTRAVTDAFKNAYRVSHKNGFDYYAKQSVIIIDDFDRKQFDFQTLLTYLDTYAVQLNCRYENKYAAYEQVFITSMKLPNEIYKDLENEEYIQLQRRINLVEVYYNFNEKKRKYRYLENHSENFLEILDLIPWRD